MDFDAVAHDLRAPLNVMLGHMQLLSVEQLSASGRKRLRVLEAQVQRMMRLLDACTEQLSRVRFAPVDFAAVIESAVSELQGVLEPRGITITWIAERDFPLLGDSDLLHRVMLNLLTNASDSIAGVGRIEVDARVRRAPHPELDTIEIHITDTGTGIPHELTPRLFESGFTTKTSATPRGFGLGICRDIIQMHGGQIRLSSTPGRGTTVSLSLPLKK